MQKFIPKQNKRAKGKVNLPRVQEQSIFPFMQQNLKLKLTEEKLQGGGKLKDMGFFTTNVRAKVTYDYMFLDIGWGVWCISIMGSTPTATNRRTTRENAV